MTTAGVVAVGVLEALAFAVGLAAFENLLDALREDGIELSVARAKTPLTAHLNEAGLSGIPLHPTARAAVEAAG